LKGGKFVFCRELFSKGIILIEQLLNENNELKIFSNFQFTVARGTSLCKLLLYNCTFAPSKKEIGCLE